MESRFHLRCVSALTHPATLAALAVLLVNDLLLKALWPGAWVPGKLSDLAWMILAPPLIVLALSFATRRRPSAECAAFFAAYAGLPLLTPFSIRSRWCTTPSSRGCCSSPARHPAHRSTHQTPW